MKLWSFGKQARNSKDHSPFSKQADSSQFNLGEMSLDVASYAFHLSQSCDAG
jgi:hypothetical protein